MCVCVRERECVCERERVRERERVCVCVREREIQSQGHTVSCPDVGIEILRHIRYRPRVLCASINCGGWVVCCKRVWEGRP